MPLTSLRRALAPFRLVLCLVMAMAVTQAGGAPRKSPADAAAPGPAPPPALPEPPLPVVQAQQLGLGACVPVLDRMARRTLTTTYDVQSAWSRDDPAHHVFQSLAALTHAGNGPRDGLAALVAAPAGAGGCDGVAVQVFPLAGNCQAAQKAILAGGGRTVAPLVNTRVMLDSGGNRLILLPGAAGTCIAVAVDSFFGSP